jgi:Raf kinase inhibitor-like YbhB/YbcL family protein
VPLQEEDNVRQNRGARLTVTSSAFENDGWMPACCTCDEENVSPDLAWDGAPEGTRSFVVWMEDRDVPAPALRLFTWVHWLVYDIPADVTSLPEALPREAVVDSGAKQGVTSFRRPGYGGPCPPIGTHRYYFMVYALDTVLGLEPGKASSGAMRRAMEGHVLAEGLLVGRYNRRVRHAEGD